MHREIKPMFFRLSNAADLHQIEETSGLSFKYPNLYNPRMLIDGLVESSLSIITMENPLEIDFAIWGLMPNGYKEDWIVLQNAQNTLNLTLDEVRQTAWMQSLLKTNRSLVLVSGFFTYYLKDGKIYPYYISLQNEEPLYLGSLYSILEDGFLTTGLLTCKKDNFISKYHNLDARSPVLVEESAIDVWLDNDTELDIIENIIEKSAAPKLRANPIASEFFKKNITYDSILNPVHHNGLPE